MKYSAAENSNVAKYNITRIFVDSRMDNTLILQHDETAGMVRNASSRKVI